MRDRNLGFLITTPIASKDSLTVLESIEEHFIAKFSVPREIVTDNGKDFSSQMFEAYTKRLGIKHKNITAYHPQSNGFIKRAHRIIKSSLRALNDPTTWCDQMPYFTLLMNNQLRDNNLFTPNQQIFGLIARLPGVIMFPPLEETGFPCSAVFTRSSKI